MSYCAIITFKDGKAAKPHTFQNSWGGAAFIWEALWNKYVRPELMEKDPGPASYYKSWLVGSDEDKHRLWDLWKREDIRMPIYEKVVLLASLDNAIVSNENLADFVEHLRRFAEAHHTKVNGLCHLEAWADFIEANQDAEGVGFWLTSVCGNPWIHRRYESEDDEDGEEEPYDLTKGDKHWEVYDELKG